MPGSSVHEAFTSCLRIVHQCGLYQGTIFFSPFFFLLVDSFFGSVVLLSAGFAFRSVAVVPSAAGVAFASPPVLAPGVVLSLEPAAGGFSAPGAVPFASGEAAGVPPPVSPVSTVDPPFAPVPGVAISTTAVLPVAPLAPVPIAVLPPPLKISVTLVLSASGSIVGVPVCAATVRSCSGPFWISALGLLSKL